MKLKVIMFSILLGVSLGSLFGEDIPQIEPSYNKINSVKRIDVDPARAGAGALVRDYYSLKPNFLTEVKFELPLEEGKEWETLSRIKSLLADFSLYNDIPYYSKRNGTWHKLFEDVERSNTFEDEWLETLTLTMLPFKRGKMEFSMKNTRDGLFFECVNIEPLFMNSIKAVKPGNMKMSLVIEVEDDRIFFYGLGGASAFDGFGLLRDRLDVAFNGRIEAFFDWMLERIQEDS